MSIETLSHLFEHCISTFNKPDLLIYRGKDDRYYNISSNEFKSRVVNTALGLKDLGIKQDSKIVLLSENRPEWHIVDFACHLLGAVLVPIFPTLIPEQIEYIVNNSEAVMIVASTKTQVEKIKKIREQVNKVKYVVAFQGEAANEDIMLFDKILEKGREQDDTGFYEDALQVAKPESLATIIYTSGTTGVPKGVMLSHKNFVSNVLDCATLLETSEKDRCLSFLPLSHSFERMIDYLFFYCGASIIYSSSIDNVAEDLERTAPTVMASVPRFYEKVKSKIEAKSAEAGGLRKKLFEWAIAVGWQKAENFLEDRKNSPMLNLRHFLASRLVLNKIQAKTGGNIRYFISGGAPLSPEIAQFFYAAGLTILEGYGLTETSPVISVNPVDKPRLGTVGKVLKSVEVKIAEDGEILVRGPNVMVGYYKMPAETDDVMTGDWFHTGDIGSFDEEGYLRITDRKKQLIVTSVGKKVAPQPIEQSVTNSKYIEQVVLVGEQRKFISALIVPDFEALKVFAEENNLTSNSPEDLIKEKTVVELIQHEVDVRQEHFSDYEKIRKFHLLPHSFTIESGHLTPTMKIKRKAVMEKYSEVIEEFYSN